MFPSQIHHLFLSSLLFSRILLIENVKISSDVDTVVLTLTIFKKHEGITETGTHLASHWSGGASEMTLPRASSTGGGLWT